MLRSRRWLKSWLLATCLASTSLAALPNGFAQAREGRTPRPFGPSCVLVHDLDLPPIFFADEGKIDTRKIVIAPPPANTKPIPDEIVGNLEERAQFMLQQSAKWICGFEISNPFSNSTCPWLTSVESDSNSNDDEAFSGCLEATAMAEGYHGFMSACPSRSYAQSLIGEDYLAYDQDYHTAVVMEEARKAIAQSVFAPFEIHQPMLVMQREWTWDSYLASDIEGRYPSPQQPSHAEEDRYAAESFLVGLGCLSPELDLLATQDPGVMFEGETCPSERQTMIDDDMAITPPVNFTPMPEPATPQPAMIDLHFVRTQPEVPNYVLDNQRVTMAESLRFIAQFLSDLSDGVDQMADRLEAENIEEIWISNEPSIDEWDLH